MPARRPLSVLLLIAAFIGSSFGSLAAPVAAADPSLLIDGFETALAAGQDANGVPIGFFTAQDGNSSTAFARTDVPPAPVPGAPMPNNVLGMTFDVSSFGVVIHGFENAAANAWVPQDWSAYAAFGFWLHGNNSGTDLFVDLIDNRNDGSTRDDAERWTVSFKDDFSGWKFLEFPFDTFTRKEIGNGAPNDGLTLTQVHGWAFGALTTDGPQTWYLDDVTISGTAPVRPLTVGFSAGAYNVREGRPGLIAVKLSRPSDSPVTVSYSTAPGSAVVGRDYTAVAGQLNFAPGVLQQSFTITTQDDAKFDSDKTVLLYLSDPSGAELGLPSLSRLTIQDNDAQDPALLDDFETPPYLWDINRNASLATRQIAAGSPLALPDQGASEQVLEVRSARGRSSFQFGRRFAQGEDWSGAEGLSFWYYGRDTGRKIKLQLLDNSAVDPGPSGWQLAWSDEFNGRAGSPPDPNTWTHEIGDGTANGNPGWGNSELQYYTDSTENAAMDGAGNLLITVREAGENSGLHCYYGPCQYTSARLISANKAEFAYGRIEARIQVPRGAGLWPAFWSLGTDIDRVGWPRTGEIDFMEHVAREPKRVFGTIHGPGYSGGDSFGDTYDFVEDVADRFHTYAVEWQPDHIVWSVDGIEYHEAVPADVAPDEWVFNHPFFLLLNVAVGGNFGGPVGPDTTFPQTMAVDYVRVYQAPDTAERFEATFVDTFSGWQRVTVPWSAFTRAAEQPAGAPDDGLTLTGVQGYAFEAPGGMRDPLLIDQVRLKQDCDDSAIVTSAADAGPGSLRAALAAVCFGGTVRFDAALANTTIVLSSGELTLARTVTVDGANAPGLAIGGGGSVRPFVVDARVAATIRDLSIVDGYGFELAGGILNNGDLTLERVTVADNVVTTSGLDFWKGGGGIYNGRDSSLTLLDSTVSGNQVTGGVGGGVMAFFDTLVTIEGSTISGNTTNDVAGGIRNLGAMTIRNSTISGNATTGWHGGAIFHTDGTLRIESSTVAGNSAPGGTTGGIFVGTFTDAGARATLRNTIVAENSGGQCLEGRFGGGAVSLASEGGNLATDASCGLLSAGDQPNTAPQLGPLADNGGATATHALGGASPALDAASADCPATDQRGVSRPQGAACDIGAYERQSAP